MADHRPQIDDELFDAADEVREERGLANINAALKRMVREGGFDV